MLYLNNFVRSWQLLLLSLTASQQVSASSLSRRFNKAFPDPNDDAFYQAPHDIEKYKVGDIIRSRLDDTAIGINGSIATQILYRTINHRNDSIATVATIWTPPKPNHDKIFAYQFAEDAINLDCNPSWAWVKNSTSNAQISDRVYVGPIVIPWALENGWYVVSTDAEGPSSGFLIGLNEGRAVLDALRATKKFAKLCEETQIALYGYSGGAHTAIWAATLAGQYAPEHNIVGMSCGGTPTDLRGAFEMDNNSPHSQLVGAAIFGLANDYPELNATLNKLITPEGRAIAADFRRRNNCTFSPNGGTPTFDYNTIFKGGAILDNPVVRAVLVRESLLMNVSSNPIPVPKFPRLHFHGTADDQVPYWTEAAYISQQCDHGANIYFKPFPDLDHEFTFFEGILGALLFVKQALTDSLPPRPKCGETGNVWMPPIWNLTAAGEILGPTGKARVQALLHTFGLD